ncbi:hypothetical protein BDZ89DRAFT_1057238, partial [Hymenopellis radicata]
MDSSPTLGKRKERDSESAHGSTLFVSNLPYTATSVDLQTLFSDIAPVRTGTGVSKGVGYVAFAIKEDAQAAFDTINREGLTLVGRNLRVQWAEQKPKDGTESIPAKQPKQPPAPRRRAPQDPIAIRTIVVTGLPSTIDSKATLWKKFRKYSGAESVEWPVDNGAAHVLFSTPSAANSAVEKLHAHRFDSLSHTKTAAKPSHASRLIVRNIPFHTTEQDLRSIFLPYGPVHSIHIPKNKDDGRMRGFAFVWMLSKKDAESAMQACNGMTLRAGQAENLVSDKQKKKKQRRLEKKALAEPAAADDADSAIDVDDAPENSSERIIAVDWALSKDKWEEEKVRLVEDDEDASLASESEVDSSDELDSQLGVHDASDDESDASEDEESGNEKPVKPQLPATDVGTTLFIRNIPFNATEEELRVLFRAFGRLRYARITVDPESERSRGTGFACFWERDDADKVIQQSDLLKSETMGSTPVVKKNPFVLPSILTPDPSSSLAQSLVLHGRTLDVVRAVTRDEAGRLKEEGERRREKADKRNMYLLREGVILPNSPAAQTMAPAELERRSSSFNARRTLLNSNPSLYVSKTRLSIRHIPVFVSERVLKRLALYAAREFDKEVKNKARNGLSKDELAVDLDEQDNEGGQIENKSKRHKAHERVKQAKIVRQHERVDPVTGKGRSKGYGFLEMFTHADALRVLRWTNNNEGTAKLLTEWYKEDLASLIVQEEKKKPEEREDGRLKRLKDEMEKSNLPVKGTLIVEFSIENVQVVQRRAAYQRPDNSKDLKRKKSKDKPAEEEEHSAPAEEERPSKKSRIEGESKPKPSNSLGSLIGRKRKQRKSKK